MKNRLVFIFLHCFFLIIYSNANSQNNATDDILNKQASIPIQSPNVAALDKFVEYPVDLFNGQADVSIPVYEIKLKNLSVPINLKYHTGGIRVSEEASWVGLGWALDVGGVISHQVRGLNDLAYGNYDQHYLPYIDKALNETYNENSQLGGVAIKVSDCKVPNKNGVMEDISNKFWGQANINYEPDLYIYNAGIYSGKFINIGTPIDLSNNNIKFNQFTGVSPIGDSIIATDPEGNTYKFKDVESDFSIVGTSSPQQTTRYNTSAYYLSEIINLNGEKVKFDYKSLQQLITENQWQNQFPDYANGHNPAYQQNGYYPLLPALFEESFLILVADVPSRIVSNQVIRSDYMKLLSYTFCKPIYLDKITFPNGEINFKKSPRLDTYGVKLDKIEIKNSLNQTVKTYNFTYDYFDTDSQPYGQDITTASNVSTSAVVSYPDNYLKKRLKLISFWESDPNMNKSEIYSFAYNETYKLPYKTSFAQDFWGYYNGSSNTTLLPSYNSYSSALGMNLGFQTGKASTVLTANRNVDKIYNQTGTLKEITFPTKGKTSYEYEPNECTNSSILSSTIETKYITASDYGVGFGRTTFTFNQQKTVNISVMLWNGNGLNTGSVINPLFGNEYGEYNNNWYVIIEMWDASLKKWMHFNAQFFWGADKVTTGSEDTYNLTNQIFSPGTYRLTASFPDNYAQYGSLGGTMSYITLSYDTTIVSNKNLVGGLRIKSITHTDNAASQPSITKKYNYSNGILVSASPFVSGYFCSNPDYSQSQYHFNNNPDAYKTSVSANPTIAFTYSANGSLVGYKNIEESYSSGNIGKINYTYKISPDISSTSWNITPDMPYTSQLTNGFLTSKEVFNNNGIYIDNQTFQPVIVNSKVYWGLIIDPRFLYFHTDAAVNMCTIANQNYFYFYPIIQGKLLVKSVYEEDYRQGVVPPVQTTINYEYNNYCNLTSKKTNDSSSGTITETYKYIPEKASESGGVYTLMQNNNIISPLIETLTDHNGKTIKQVTNYYQPYGNIYAPSSFQLQIGDNPIETRITYDTYDKFGNTNSITKNNADKVVYLWGYNYQYPIAEIKNSTFSDVCIKIGNGNEQTGKNTLETIAEKNEPAAADWTSINNLRTQLPYALITTYTYKPLVGMTSEIAPNGIVTSYEYDSFGRLSKVTKADKVIKSYMYNYKN